MAQGMNGALYNALTSLSNTPRMSLEPEAGGGGDEWHRLSMGLSSASFFDHVMGIMAGKWTSDFQSELSRLEARDSELVQAVLGNEQHHSPTKSPTRASLTSPFPVTLNRPSCVSDDASAPRSSSSSSDGGQSSGSADDAQPADSGCWGVDEEETGRGAGDNDKDDPNPYDEVFVETASELEPPLPVSTSLSWCVLACKGNF